MPTAATDPALLSPQEGTAPAQLRVPSANLTMDVTGVGVQRDGDMELPASVAVAGWYKYGARPADPTGSTLIAAHVDSRAEGLGPFARLRRVKPDASALLITRDGTVHRYRISSVQKVAKQQLPSTGAFQREGSRRLTLLTCGGAYDQANGYSDNVVVTGTPETDVTS